MSLSGVTVFCLIYNSDVFSQGNVHSNTEIYAVGIKIDADEISLLVRELSANQNGKRDELNFVLFKL